MVLTYLQEEDISYRKIRIKNIEFIMSNQRIIKVGPQPAILKNLWIGLSSFD